MAYKTIQRNWVKSLKKPSSVMSNTIAHCLQNSLNEGQKPENKQQLGEAGLFGEED